MQHDMKRGAFLAKAASRFNMSRRTLYRYLRVVDMEEIKEEFTRLKGEKLLTFKQVATKLNCSRSSVYRWATEEGKIQYIRLFGSILRIRQSELDRILVEGELNAP